MKVIVCGAGQVGYNIAKHLADQQNDVTVVDRSPDLITKLSDALEVQGIVGFASDPEMLERAGAGSADLLIAVTMSDEVNMVACQLAHSLFGVPTKIARIRNQSYLRPGWADLFSRDNLPIDVIISPELEAAEALHRRLQIPGAFNMVPFVDGRVRLIGLTLDESCPVLGTPLRQLSELFPTLQASIPAVVRGERIFVPRAEDQLKAGDSVYVAVDTALTDRTLAVFGHEEKAAQRIVIIGGGNIGFFLADHLEHGGGATDVKLIELNPERAALLKEKLKKTEIITGDALDEGILAEANVGKADTVVSVVDDDEVNILVSLLAKRLGCSSVITLTTSSVYSSLIGSLGIDVALDPRETTVSSIVRHIRRGRIRDLYSIFDGKAEIIEAEVLAGSEVAGREIGTLKLHGDVKFGMLVREDEVIVPNADTMLEAGDRVVIMALSGAVRRVEKLFSAKADLF